MDTSIRLASAITLLAVGCGISATSHAYSKQEDAAAQDREVQAAYDRGYKAARQEMANKAAASAAATAPAAAPVAKKPIHDQKFTYSDAGDAATVVTVPVVVKPAANREDAQAVADPRAVVEVKAGAPAANEAGERDGTATTPAKSRSERPPAGTYAQAPATRQPVAAAPAAQANAAPPQSLADDEVVDDEEAPRQDLLLSTTQSQQPSQPPARYAPPPQPYGYAQQPAYAQRPQPAYAQQPYPQQYPQYPQQYGQEYAQQWPQQPVYAQQQAYAQPQAAYYAQPAPQAPWGAQYQPQPQARGVYWSPQYGRWIYY
jgi:hypothetical protein